MKELLSTLLATTEFMDPTTKIERAREDVLNYVLIIAHPDDESMFFLPTIYNIAKTAPKRMHQIFILCLSNGNYDNLGTIRERELQSAAEIISSENTKIKVTIVEDEKLQDGPKEAWPADLIADKIRDFISAEKMENEKLILMTFDEEGVSNHINHIHTYDGVLKFFSRHDCDGTYLKVNQKIFSRADVSLELWTLKSINNPLMKYFPITILIQFMLEWLYFVTTKSRIIEGNRCRRFCMINPALVWSAMRAHSSQFVWYRRLFVIFSRYSYVNDLTVHEWKRPHDERVLKKND